MKITVEIPEHDWEFFKTIADMHQVSAKKLLRMTLARCAEGARRQSWEVNARDSMEASAQDLVEINHQPRHESDTKNN